MAQQNERAVSLRRREINRNEYKDWRASTDDLGNFRVPSKPIYAYRGDPAVFRCELAELAAAHGISYTPRDIEALAALTAFSDIAMFFSSHNARANSVHGALLFFRRGVAHAHAYIAGTKGYVFTRGCTRLIARDKYVQDIEHAYSKEPGTAFTWHVLIENAVYAINFNRTVAEDPIMWYKDITADASNPVSRLYTPPVTSPDTLDIGPQLVHVESMRGWSQEKLDDEAAAARADPDVMFLLNHFKRILDPPANASARLVDKYVNDGRHLQLLVAWCIQNMARSTQIVTVFSPVQQCGKSTIFSLLLALLGVHSVIMMPADMLMNGFLACLRGILFLFLDEGAAALTPALMDRSKMLTGIDRIRTENKNEHSMETTNRITMLITSNKIFYNVQAGSERICPVFSTGMLQGNVAYFDKLYDLAARTDVARRAFLVLSRTSLTQIEDGVVRDFRTSVPSELGAEYLAAMADNGRCRVYEKLQTLLANAASSYLPTKRVTAEVLKLVEHEPCMTNPATVAAQIIADLLQRAILRFHPAESFVYLVAAAATDDAFAHCAGATDDTRALRKMVTDAVRDENGVPFSEVVRIAKTELAARGVPDAQRAANEFISALVCDQVLTMRDSPPYVSTCLRIRKPARFDELGVENSEARKRRREILI